MMKTLKNLLLVAVIGLSVYSCKDDELTDPSAFPFTEESVDEGKANLEDAGQAMVVEMNAMKDVGTGNALESFAECASNDDPFETTTVKSAPVFRTITAASDLSSGKINLPALSKIMKLDAEEDSTFQQVFNSCKGIYTWDITNKVWKKTTSSAEFKFIFPSKVDGTTNDATMVITYTGKTGVYPLENYRGDLPASFNVSIIVKAKTVFEIDLKASYNSDGMPTSVNYFIALYPYKYEISWTYSTSSITLRYHLTNDTKNIIDCFGGIGGNFSKSNINDDSKGIDDVFYNGNAYFQVFNIKLAGDIDYKKLNAAMQTIRDSEMTEDEAIDAMVKEMNSDMHLNLVYADSKEKIASAEAYYDNVEDELAIRFIFADGTKGDLETYFNAGFEDFIDDLNAFIVELNNDYDLTIEPVVTQ